MPDSLIFSTYGPGLRLDSGRALPAFMKQAMNGENITAFGDGAETRSFCYMDDLLEAICGLLFSYFYLPLNISNLSEASLSEFAKDVVSTANTKSKIVFQPLPQDDPPQRQPDICKAKSILNWLRLVDKKEG